MFSLFPKGCSTVGSVSLTPGFSRVEKRTRNEKTVSTVFLDMPLQTVPLDQSLQFLNKTAFPMMFFLVRNVASDIFDSRLGDRQGAVASLPPRLAATKVLLVHPVPGTAVTALDDFCNR